MCDLDYDDGPKAWNETERRARKRHTCYACKEIIRAGDHYHYSSGIWDGSPNSYHHCLRCWAMIRAITTRIEGPCELNLNCGEVWDDPPLEIAKLAFVTADEMQASLAVGVHK